MATFSWSDNLKIAFKSCSPCLWAHQDDADSVRPDEGNRPINRLSLAQGSDELHGLLANADTDVEAERMSLHSNPGQRKKKKTSRRRLSRKTSSDTSQRRITLFGYNLFGRPPPIQLANDSEDALYPRHGTMTPNTTHSTLSSAFDSDAAPLDTDTIAALSSPTTAAAAIKAAVQASAEVEAQRLKEKEERRRKRRAKKELKRMAGTLEQQGIIGDGEEFEGFQGSGAENPGSKYPRISSGMFPGSDSGSVRQVQPIAHPQDDDDTADLDGSHYARNTSGGSNGGSDSRSRTSASLSDRMQPPSNPIPPAIKKKSTTKSSSSRKTKSSSSNTSQTSSFRQVISPSTIEQGQGFFDLEDEDVPVRKPDPGYLPITSFGGKPATSRMASNLGAILAQRGNDGSENR